MSIPGWRYICERQLAEAIGPMAGILIDESLADLDVKEHEITASHYLQFIRVLYGKLPGTVDRRAICQKLQVEVLKAYGFGKPGAI